MIEVRAYFTDHHVNSAQAIAKILANDWPITNAVVEFADRSQDVYQGSHSSKCTDCITELYLPVNIYRGRHRVE